MFEDNLIQAQQMLLGKGKHLENGIFFNECEDEQESNQSSDEGESEEEEDGEYDPNLQAHVLAGGEEY